MEPDFRQAELFAFPCNLPRGLLYQADFLAPADEATLVAAIASLPLREARFREYFAHRRVVHFHDGIDAPRYDDDADAATTLPLPPVLADLRARIAAWLELPATAFVHVLVSEYRPGTPIGWHRDKPAYGIVAGVSLHGWGRMRFRPYGAREARHTVSLDLAPRSIYVMRDAIRWQWQHSMLPTRELRYSVTLRTRADATESA